MRQTTEVSEIVPKRPACASSRLAAQAPGFWEVRVRRVGYVPVVHRNEQASPGESDAFAHLSGYVPDPLFDEHGGASAARDTNISV